MDNTLTPQQIQTFNKVTGWNTPATPVSQPTQSRSQEIMSIAHQAQQSKQAQAQNAPGISVNSEPTDITQPVKQPFSVNTDTFGFKDIPAGVGATLGNAVAAPATAVQQAVRMPEQVGDIFTQNGGQGVYGKYSEGVDSIMQGINKAIFDPLVSGATTLGNIAGGVENKLIRGLTNNQNFGKNSSLGQQGDEALANAPKSARDALAGASKFGIEQPTTAALALQQGYQQLTKNPQADLIHDVGSKTIDTAKNVGNKLSDMTQPMIENIKAKASTLANSLEQESMRLTPIQKAKLGGRINEISQFNIDNGIKGSPATRLAKINDVVDNYDNTLDNYLKTEVPDNSVDVQTLTDRLNNLKVKYSASDMADLESAGKQVDGAVNRLSSYGDDIQTARLNNLKSSYYRNSYGNQIGSGLTDEVQGDIARVYKEAIEENLKGSSINGQSIEDFNHDYGNALVSKRILTAAIGKPQLGPIARLTAKGVGAVAGSVAGLPGEIIGGLYGDKLATYLAGTHARSIISDILSGDTEPYLPDMQSTNPPASSNTIEGNTPNTSSASTPAISNVDDTNPISPSVAQPENNVNHTLENSTEGGYIKNPFSNQATASIDQIQEDVKSSGGDWDKAIQAGDIPKEQIYNKDGTFTPMATDHVVSDLAGKIDRIVPGLGDQFKSFVNTTEPTQASLIKQATQFIDSVKNNSPLQSEVNGILNNPKTQGADVAQQAMKEIDGMLAKIDPKNIGQTASASSSLSGSIGYMPGQGMTSAAYDSAYAKWGVNTARATSMAALYDANEAFIESVPWFWPAIAARDAIIQEWNIKHNAHYTTRQFILGERNDPLDTDNIRLAAIKQSLDENQRIQEEQKRQEEQKKQAEADQNKQNQQNQDSSYSQYQPSNQTTQTGNQRLQSLLQSIYGNPNSQNLQSDPNIIREYTSLGGKLVNGKIPSLISNQQGQYTPSNNQGANAMDAKLPAVVTSILTKLSPQAQANIQDTKTHPVELAKAVNFIKSIGGKVSDFEKLIAKNPSQVANAVSAMKELAIRTSRPEEDTRWGHNVQQMSPDRIEPVFYIPRLNPINGKLSWNIADTTVPDKQDTFETKIPDEMSHPNVPTDYKFSPFLKNPTIIPIKDSKTPPSSVYNTSGDLPNNIPKDYEVKKTYNGSASSAYNDITNPKDASSIPGGSYIDKEGRKHTITYGFDTTNKQDYYNNEIKSIPVSPEVRKIIDDYLKKQGEVGPLKKISHYDKDKPTIGGVYYGDQYARDQIVQDTKGKQLVKGAQELLGQTVSKILSTLSKSK